MHSNQFNNNPPPPLNIIPDLEDSQEISLVRSKFWKFSCLFFNPFVLVTYNIFTPNQSSLIHSTDILLHPISSVSLSDESSCLLSLLSALFPAQQPFCFPRLINPVKIPIVIHLPKNVCNF